MSKLLVGSYDLGTANNQSYLLTFSIPQNCEFHISEDKGIYTILVTLQSGQTEPSGTFITYQQTFVPIEGVIHIEFDQQECNGDTAVQRKPVLRIEQ